MDTIIHYLQRDDGAVAIVGARDMSSNRAPIVAKLKFQATLNVLEGKFDQTFHATPQSALWDVDGMLAVLQQEGFTPVRFAPDIGAKVAQAVALVSEDILDVPAHTFRISSVYSGELKSTIYILTHERDGFHFPAATVWNDTFTIE